MKELIVISGKGGTGKTSIVGALASMVKDTVFADCDVDAADLYLLLKPGQTKSQPFYGRKKAFINTDICRQCGLCKDLCRFDAISDNYVIDTMSCEGCAVCVHNCPHNAIFLTEHQSGSLFISETRQGPMIHARLEAGEENSGKLVSLVRSSAKQEAEKLGYDKIIVDGPPGTGCPVIASVGNADLLLIVTEPSLSAIHDLKRVHKLALFFQVPVCICINRFDINPELTESITDYAKKFNIKIVAWIPYNPEILKAQKLGQSIFEMKNGELSALFLNMWNNTRDILFNMN